ncbi:glycosyltransferase family 4 protein [Candidatus Nitrotoga sp. M5]|uniref:glycosyltransferase family 4 protein n=1 Tax=Candidatus Nitrotoga sp. M5 TaxID=2890409 RepID=UPI001EF2E614|nr:glycosyltransferase family 4 protein [Candidatus Nitrotoga sp. M5]CAH1385744.1 Glycosyltransferase involved in cell wall bisynthesis [Candidatus Nitrotoga sp. M5]
MPNIKVQNMKVAVIHDWLTVYAGAERVLEQILLCYPNADLYSVVDFIPSEKRGFLLGKTATTSFVQILPFARTKYRQYLSLMPLAVEQFDLSSYDLVISCSHAVAKGVITGPDQLHISYVNSPMRYAWDLQHQYLRDSGLDKDAKGWLAKWVLHKMRIWDVRTANGVDFFIANSHFIRRRIWKTYRRDAAVLYPSVEISKFTLREDKEDFYLTASRLVPYKKIDLIAETFTAMPEKRLIIIGDGPEMQKVRAKAGANVTVLGYKPDDVLRDYMQRAKAFIFAAEEDFGIVPLEAQACGTPVIAYGKGGVLETIRGLDDKQPTGVFFAEQSISAIKAAVTTFEQEAARILPVTCRDNACRFEPEKFRAEFMTCVGHQWDRFQQSLTTAPSSKV